MRWQKEGVLLTDRRRRRRACCEVGGVGFLDDNSTTLLQDGGGAHLRISSRDGAKVAGWGAAAGVVIVEEA